jgi:antitoxin MazE
MLVSVIPIGNSRGIRIPKSILQQLNIEESLELEIHDKEIVLKPVNKKPRENWVKAFKDMHNNGDDKIIIDDFDEQADFQWEW